MIELVLIVLILVSSLLYAQHKHYEFLRLERKNNDFVNLSDTLQSKLKDFDDVKRRVDALVVRAGFKL